MKNGLAEERGGQEGGGKKGKGGLRVQWEWQGNREEHVFKSMLIYPSSQTKQIQTRKKCSSFLRTLLKVNFKFKMEETASQGNTYHNIPWILKLTGTGYSSCSTVF